VFARGALLQLWELVQVYCSVLQCVAVCCSVCSVDDTLLRAGCTVTRDMSMVIDRIEKIHLLS